MLEQTIKDITERVVPLAKVSAHPSMLLMALYLSHELCQEQLFLVSHASRVRDGEAQRRARHFPAPGMC